MQQQRCVLVARDFDLSYFLWYHIDMRCPETSVADFEEYSLYPGAADDAPLLYALGKTVAAVFQRHQWRQQIIEGGKVAEFIAGQGLGALHQLDEHSISMDNNLRHKAIETGYDEELLDKALGSFMAHDGSVERIMRQYHLMRTLSDTVGGIDIGPVLAERAKQGRRVDTSTYDLSAITSNAFRTDARGAGYVYDWGNADPAVVSAIETSNDNWLDTTSGIVLLHNRVPQAKAAFRVTSADTLLITEVQGVSYTTIHGKKYKKHCPGGLEPLDWRSAMVELVEGVAVRNGFATIGLQGAANLTWLNEKFTEEAARTVYDDVAERCGYQRHSDGNWYQNLGLAA